MTPPGPPPRVLLLSMPFGAIERPSLGLSLLAGSLRRAGVGCRVKYLTFALAEFLGIDEYLWISNELPYTAFAGDWSFARALHGEDPVGQSAYIEEILRGVWYLDDASVNRVMRVRAYCEHFLDHCMSAIPWDEYDLVGFTSTFEQNIASLALARRIKAAHPRIAIVFGGANWEGEMGHTLHESFPFVDYVCSGEADHSFPALVEALSTPGADVGAIAGVVYRDRSGASISTGPAALVEDLNDLAYPDFDDYFTDQMESPAASGLTANLPVETARGCWWGARSHCTFCGLNGGSMAFRSKSAARAVEEIKSLRDRYGVSMFYVTDNILDMRYFRTTLRQLVDERVDVQLFYEVKANLTHSQVRLLSEAGVRFVQPGIESMSDHVLELMRKGTTALKNVQLLKWCREFGIHADWNLLFGFPGETAEDYEDMLPFLDAIWFLGPPGAYGQIRLDRFSPFHADPAGFGMTNVRALATYRHLYPFEPDRLDRIAYYFDFDYSDGRDPQRYVEPVLAKVRVWQADENRGALWVRPGTDGSVVIVDERPTGLGEPVGLEGWQAAVYEACDHIRTLDEIAALDAVAVVEREDLLAFLDWCVAWRTMLRAGDDFLSLAVHTPPRVNTSPPQTRRLLKIAAVGA